MENLSGQIIKGYELKERLGTGSFGAVYKAHQSTIQAMLSNSSRGVNKKFFRVL
jgi:hypothetical protein